MQIISYPKSSNFERLSEYPILMTNQLFNYSIIYVFELTDYLITRSLKRYLPKKYRQNIPQVLVAL